ncbi:DUF2798 domain-containing protein [Alkalibacter mobilis]|uniref:DUF2798 domain-containing protein n=1 Tax=Alkalibacter mobilis TaxID=2787712 RepID=UPI00189C7B1C|nr:DUF2798 domain-containing protein [Alkalibacter mobilis]MBF7095610.1 DUF2798 domain-containing protein [Alkalibacter mobilis]
MNLKQVIFMNFLIALSFSVAMGFAMLYINVGMVPGFMQMWMGSTLTGFLVALPLSFIIVPPIQKLSMKLFTSKN